MSEKVVFEYHQLVFEALNKKHYKKFMRVLHERPVELRRKLFRQYLAVDEVYEGFEAWEICKIILDEFEENFRKVLSKRDPLYWMHIYRRIGVLLSDGHESNTDPYTTGLVRKIAELAIFKYSNINQNNQIFPACRLNPEEVMSGLFLRSLKNFPGLSKEEKSVLILETEELFKTSGSLVLKNFTYKDLESVYFTEGIAYQYWRLSALLRYIGKGGKFKVDEFGDFVYLNNPGLDFLVYSYDQRIIYKDTSSLLSGIWIGKMDFNKLMSSKRNMWKSFPLPVYNAYRNFLPSGTQLLNHNLSMDYIPNFITYEFSVDSFLKSTKFMNKDFAIEKGFSLNELMSVVYSLCSLQMLPEYFYIKYTEEQLPEMISRSIKQMISRGYAVLSNKNDLIERTNVRIRELKLKRVKKHKIHKILCFLTLDIARQEQIGLWSGGPRPFLINNEKFTVFDSSGVYDLLQNIFFRIRDSSSLKGDFFEEHVRQYISGFDFTVISGVKRNADGVEREIDAGVVIEKTLYIFECFASERSLDYNISKPSVLFGSPGSRNPSASLGKNGMLLEKLEQVEGLKNFFLDYPAGKNYNFNDIENIEHFVVSPFVEWIWDDDDRFWYSQSIPRIISPIEAYLILSQHPKAVD